MMNVTFDIANKDDISELIRLRIMYIIEDYGCISEDERRAMEKYHDYDMSPAAEGIDKVMSWI